MSTLYYLQPADEALSASEITSQVGLDPEFVGFLALNSAGVYPITEVTNPYDQSLYDVSLTYTVNGTNADQTWTPTPKPLADAKAAGIAALKEQAKTELETETDSYPLLALIASASRLQADRDADAEAVLADLRSTMAQLQSDIDSVNAATTVDEIDAIVNP